MNVSAVIVTRGDQDISKIVDSLYKATGNIVLVWDNSRAPMPPQWWWDSHERRQVHWCGSADLAVYGRYAALESCFSDVVLVQDDDCLLPPESLRALIDAYEPGVLVANMPQPFRVHYSDSCLVGFGAIFDRDLPGEAFFRFSTTMIMETGESVDEALFNRTCDVVFTTLTPFRLVDLPYENMPWATGPDRMYRSPSHVGERARMLDLARQVRDAS